MRRYGPLFNVVVKDEERGFLYRDGRFVRLLEPGRERVFDPAAQMSAELFKVVRAEIPAERALLMEKTQPAIAEKHFAIVQAGPAEVAIVRSTASSSI